MSSTTVRSIGVSLAAALPVAAVATVPLSIHASGFDDVGNSPVVVLPMAAAAVLLAGSAAAISQRAPRLLLAGAGLAVFGYLLSTAALAWHGSRVMAGPGPAEVSRLTQWLVALTGIGWVPPMTFLTAAVLAGLRSLGLAGGRVRALLAGLFPYTLVGAGLATVTTPAAPDSPYAALPPLWDEPVAAVVAQVMLVPWMAIVVLGPVIAWRCVARARPEARARAVTLAVAATVPPLTIICCLAATLLAQVAGVLSVNVGAAVLSIAYHLPLIIAGPVMVRALGEPGPELPSPRQLSAALTASLGLPMLIVAVAVAWLVAERFGGGGLAVAVMIILGLGAAAAAALRRLVGSLIRLVDPIRSRIEAALPRSTGVTPAESLQQVARTVLGNPTATLTIRRTDGRWVRVDGEPATTPATPTTPEAHLDPPGPDAAAVLTEAQELVERAVLELSVRAQEAALTEARRDAAAARTAERQRLERDLHDGVQGRLLALALDLKVSHRSLPASEASLVIADAVEALGRAIDELRSLSRGTGPELLSRRGLRVALTDFASTLPFLVTLVRAPDRLPPVAESVVYLGVCEAVTNALKHARAESVEIEIDVIDDVAVVRVSDDGVGGADLRAGTGLLGLSERVGALGGRLLVSDRRPSGTLVELTVPCGS